MSASLVGSEMCIRDRLDGSCMMDPPLRERVVVALLSIPVAVGWPNGHRAVRSESVRSLIRAASE
eukprot:4301187-Alexandrium_andersonii.AAC.1